MGTSPIPLLTQEHLRACQRLINKYYQSKRSPAGRAEAIRDLRVILSVGDAPPEEFEKEIKILARRYQAASNMTVVVGRGLAEGQEITYLGMPAKITAINDNYTVNVSLFDSTGKKVGGRGHVSPFSCNPTG